MFRKADFDLENAQRGIVLLDGLDNIGMNAIDCSLDARSQERVREQIHSDITKIIEGTKVDVSRASLDSKDNEESSSDIFDTSKLFFVCFGVSDSFMPSTKDPWNKGLRKSMPLVSKRSASSASSPGSLSTPMTVSKSIAISCNPKKNFPKGGEEDDSGRGSSEQEESKLEEVLSGNCCESDLDEYEYMEDYMETTREEERQLEKLMTEIKDVRLPQCQAIWGMKDISITFAQDALEIIATQVSKSLTFPFFCQWAV